MHNRKQHVTSKQDFETAVRFYCGMRPANSSSSSSTTNTNSTLTSKQIAAEEIAFDYISAQFAAYAIDLGVSLSGPDAETDDAAPGFNNNAAMVLTDARRVVCKHLVDLFAINELRTCKLVVQLLRSSVSDIIQATQKNPLVQFNLLKALLVDFRESPGVPGEGRELSDCFSPQDILAYLRLLLVFAPDDVLRFLSGTTQYPLDEALALCRDKEVLDASAYLLERQGDAAGALQLLCSDISKRIQTAKAEIDVLLRPDPVSGSGIGRRPSTLTPGVGGGLGNANPSPNVLRSEQHRATLQQILQADKQSSLRQELAATLPWYSKMLHVTDLAANICNRFV